LEFTSLSYFWKIGEFPDQEGPPVSAHFHTALLQTVPPLPSDSGHCGYHHRQFAAARRFPLPIKPARGREEKPFLHFASPTPCSSRLCPPLCSLSPATMKPFLCRLGRLAAPPSSTGGAAAPSSSNRWLTTLSDHFSLPSASSTVDRSLLTSSDQANTSRSSTRSPCSSSSTPSLPTTHCLPHYQTSSTARMLHHRPASPVLTPLAWRARQASPKLTFLSPLTKASTLHPP
jgi:hypothetical protein